MSLAYLSLGVLELNHVGSRAMTFQQQISLHTRGHGEMHELTEDVVRVVRASGIQTGTVNVFTIGSTAAVGTIEFEPGLQRDLPCRRRCWGPR